MKPLALFAPPWLLACSSLLSAAPAVDHLRLSVIPTASSSGAAEAMVVSGGRWGGGRRRASALDGRALEMTASVMRKGSFDHRVIKWEAEPPAPKGQAACRLI